MYWCIGLMAWVDILSKFLFFPIFATKIYFTNIYSSPFLHEFDVQNCSKKDYFGNTKITTQKSLSSSLAPEKRKYPAMLGHLQT